MDRKTFPLQRWLNVALRGLHLVAVILLGAALLGAPVAGGTAVFGVAATGLAMLVLDTWSKPSHLREASGIAVLVKLVLVGWMAADESSRFALFWVVVAGSAIFAHAPARFRHAVVFSRAQRPQHER
jgi:hypothetical protein